MRKVASRDMAFNCCVQQFSRSMSVTMKVYSLKGVAKNDTVDPREVNTIQLIGLNGPNLLFTLERVNCNQNTANIVQGKKKPRGRALRPRYTLALQSK